MPFTPLRRLPPPPAAPPSPLRRHSALDGNRGGGHDQAEPCRPQDTVPGCSQWTHPESARLGQPQGWPPSRSVRTTENSTWHREDAGLCQRRMSPHTLARPGPEPSGRTSASGTSSGTFLEEQRKDRAEERRDRPWGTPQHFRTPGPPATYLAIAETVYNGDKKSLWGEGRGSGPEPGSAGGEAAPAPRPGCGRRTWKELKSIS